MTKRCCDCEHPQPCEVISCDECRIECPGCATYAERVKARQEKEKEAKKKKK